MYAVTAKRNSSQSRDSCKTNFFFSVSLYFNMIKHFPVMFSALIRHEKN